MWLPDRRARTPHIGFLGEAWGPVTGISDDIGLWAERGHRDHVFDEAIGILMQRHDSWMDEATACLRGAAELLGVDPRRLGQLVVESTNSRRQVTDPLGRGVGRE